LAELDQIPAKSALARAFLKRSSGESMLPDETAAMKEYLRRHRELRFELHWVDLQEKEEMQKRAQADGYRSFGKWVRAMVHRGISKSNRTGEEWQVLENRLHQAEKQLEVQMAMTFDILKKSNRYERERDDALDKLRALEVRLAPR
jgi:hypothetical protein